jgi:molecular chaperone GrpE
MNEEEITGKNPQEDNQSNPQTLDEAVEVLEAELAVQIENLEEELEACQAKSAEYLDGWQRARAEFANYKKRVEREQAQAYQNAAAQIFRRFLDVLDDLDRALKNRPQGEEGAAWAAGIELVYRKLYSILEAEGVSVMQAEGQYFDPNLHEAISQEENEQYDSGQIIDVLKKGYMMGDRVLRVATVRVAK